MVGGIWEGLQQEEFGDGADKTTLYANIKFSSNNFFKKLLTHCHYLSQDVSLLYPLLIVKHLSASLMTTNLLVAL